MTQFYTRPRARPWPVFAEPEAEKKAFAVAATFALAATIGVHLLAFFCFMLIDLVPSAPPAVRPVHRTVSVELLEQPSLPEFVEANPAANQEKPDETDQTAAQDQRAAQPEESDPASDANRPKIDGEAPDSQKIVEGSLTQTLTPRPVDQAQNDQGNAVSRGESAPEQSQGGQPQEARGDQSRDATYGRVRATEAEPNAEGTIPVLEKPGESDYHEQEQEQEKTIVPGPDGPRQVKVVEEQVAPTRPGGKQPRPRPRLSFETPPGPLMRNTALPSRMGAVAIDAEFSEYGQYTQRMLEAISQQWNLLGQQAGYLSSEIGTRVVARFVLNKLGEVDELQVIYSDANNPATVLVTNAIQSRSPYGPWTADMINSLGTQHTVTISFHYR